MIWPVTWLTHTDSSLCVEAYKDRPPHSIPSLLVSYTSHYTETKTKQLTLVTRTLKNAASVGSNNTVGNYGSHEQHTHTHTNTRTRNPQECKSPQKQAKKGGIYKYDEMKSSLKTAQLWKGRKCLPNAKRMNKKARRKSQLLLTILTTGKVSREHFQFPRKINVFIIYL